MDSFISVYEKVNEMETTDTLLLSYPYFMKVASDSDKLKYKTSLD